MIDTNATTEFPKAGFETIQAPKEHGMVQAARELAGHLEKKAGVPGSRVPIYGAVKYAIELALEQFRDSQTK
jgi:hypothetical protein